MFTRGYHRFFHRERTQKTPRCEAQALEGRFEDEAKPMALKAWCHRAGWRSWFFFMVFFAKIFLVN